MSAYVPERMLFQDWTKYHWVTERPVSFRSNHDARNKKVISDAIRLIKSEFSV